MISLPLGPKVIKKEGNKAIFEIGELFPGYGITIGNALRRVLLSSLEGAAITQVKIKNVSHEFSTIPGVLEDVINIILNLKKLRFKNFSDEAQKAILIVKGKKEVKGSDFKVPSQLELASKDVHIATLTSKDAKLEIEVKIEKGIGYQIKDRDEEDVEVGVILMDSIFTPVQKVSFGLENMRVGDRTDFDKLSLEIETDGTISPEEALSQASDILLKHFDLISGSFEKKETKKKDKKKASKETKKPAKKEKKEVKKIAKKTKKTVKKTAKKPKKK